MPINSAREKFVHELADLCDAEHQFLEAQHEMHSQATDERLKVMIAEHIAESEHQVMIDGAQLLDLWEPLKLRKQNREQEARTARRLERTSPRLLMQVPV